MRLPEVPVHVGLLWRTAAEAIECPKGDFVLALCPECGYAWNDVFDVGRLTYEHDYDNSLHFSPKFASWEEALALRLVERHALTKRRIAEIGCGDGRFLSMLCRAGENSGIGFEPGHNDRRVSELVASADVQIIRGYADSSSLRATGADFVVTRHVLEHIPDPSAFVELIRGGLDDGASIYVEVPNFANTLARGAFEDLMYEHCGYYTPETLALLLRRHGCRVVDASATFDDLFASVEARIGLEPLEREGIAQDVIEQIRAAAGDLRDRIGRVEDELAARRRDGQVLAAWGGGARAVGLLNLVASSPVVSRVVDVNPRKQGTFVAGTGHPIVAPEALAADPPDAVVIVNPVYRAEIVGMLDALGVETQVITV